MVELAIEEVTAAILLASERRPSKVLVCNLAHWASAVDSARALADEVDVDIEFIARADGRGRDIVVRGR